jgi:hypothetical protein
MFEAIAFLLAEADQLVTLLQRNAAQAQALQQPLDAGHRSLEFVAGELQQLFHVLALLFAPLRQQVQHHQAARQQQRHQRGFADQHHIAAVMVGGDFRKPGRPLLLVDVRPQLQHLPLQHLVGEHFAAQQDGPPRHQGRGGDHGEGEHDQLGALREPLAEAGTHQAFSLVASTSRSLSTSAVL